MVRIGTHVEAIVHCLCRVMDVILDLNTSPISIVFINVSLYFAAFFVSGLDVRAPPGSLSFPSANAVQSLQAVLQPYNRS